MNKHKVLCREMKLLHFEKYNFSHSCVIWKRVLLKYASFLCHMKHRHGITTDFIPFAGD